METWIRVSGVDNGIARGEGCEGLQLGYILERVLIGLGLGSRS
jgi:hypothetical protein